MPAASPPGDALRPLGILGGTFDPVHHAHLQLAREALAALSLASVRWVPSGTPAHRGAPRAGAADRLAMLDLALDAEPRYAIDAAELRSAAPTYTVHTLERLRAELGPQVPLVFLIGADHLITLDRWKEWKRLFELAHFGVARRPGYALASLSGPVAQEYARRRCAPADLPRQSAGRIVVFDMTPLAISSSAIRRAFSEGRLPREALPPPVLDYIERNSLYRPLQKGMPSSA